MLLGLLCAVGSAETLTFQCDKPQQKIRQGQEFSSVQGSVHLAISSNSNQEINCKERRERNHSNLSFFNLCHKLPWDWVAFFKYLTRKGLKAGIVGIEGRGAFVGHSFCYWAWASFELREAGNVKQTAPIVIQFCYHLLPFLDPGFSFRG